MLGTAARLVSAIVIAATGVYLGVRLYNYADVDDAPGGMVVAMAMVFGAVALGVWIALPRRRTGE